MKGQRLLRAEHAHIRNALKRLAFKSSVDDQVKSNSDLPTWHLICSKDTIFIISICLLSAECYSSLQIIQRRRASNMEVCLLYFFCGDDENASVYPTIKRRNFLCCMKRLSFSSMGCKDGIYEEIKEHLGLNEPLGAAVSLLPEPCRPTADISLCHSHHSNVVISPIRSVVTLANTHTHTPSTCTQLLPSPVISTMLFVLMTGIYLECDIFILFLLYIKTFFFLLGQEKFSGEGEKPKSSSQPLSKAPSSWTLPGFLGLVWMQLMNFTHVYLMFKCMSEE